MKFKPIGFIVLYAIFSTSASAESRKCDVSNDVVTCDDGSSYVLPRPVPTPPVQKPTTLESFVHTAANRSVEAPETWVKVRTERACSPTFLGSTCHQIEIWCRYDPSLGYRGCVDRVVPGSEEYDSTPSVVFFRFYGPPHFIHGGYYTGSRYRRW